jgi:hypothetical protein
MDVSIIALKKKTEIKVANWAYEKQKFKRSYLEKRNKIRKKIGIAVSSAQVNIGKSPNVLLQ